MFLESPHFGNTIVYEKSVFFTLDEGSDGFVVTGIWENGGSVLLYDEHLNLKWAKNNLNSFSVASDGIKFLSYVTFKNGNIIVTGPSFNGNSVSVLETTFDSEGNILGQKEIAQNAFPIGKTNEGKIIIFNQKEIQITNSDNDILKIDKAIFGSIPYQFTEGMNQTYNNKNMTFKLNGPRALLNEIYIDGVLLSSEDYTVEGDDNTVIILSKNYLNKLDFSNHKIKANYKNGSVDETTFNFDVENPSTYDEGIDQALFLGLLGLLGLSVFIYKVKKI